MNHFLIFNRQVEIIHEEVTIPNHRALPVPGIPKQNACHKHDGHEHFIASTAEITNDLCDCYPKGAYS